MTGKRWLLGALTVIAGGLGIGLGWSAIASASIPDASGTITTCYRPSGPAQGNLVVIDGDTETCPTGYTELTWQQVVDAQSLGREVVTSSGVAGSQVEVLCPTGKVAVAGGVKWSGVGSSSLANFSVVSSYPTTSGWHSVWRNSAAGTTVDAYAICVNE